jgi:hypothetical protein
LLQNREKILKDHAPGRLRVGDTGEQHEADDWLLWPGRQDKVCQAVMACVVPDAIPTLLLSVREREEAPINWFNENRKRPRNPESRGQAAP